MVVNMKINKYLGFTLSEVMITIVMVGVIASLTVTNIGSSLHQKARTAEFRTAYALLSGALNSTIVDNGHAFACYTCPSQDDIQKYALTIDDQLCSEEHGHDFVECDNFETKFLNNLHATYSCLNNPVAEGCIPEAYQTRANRSGLNECFNSNYNSGRAYILENSMIIFPEPNVNNFSKFAMDINGKKGPNIWGQDIFTFAIVPSEQNPVGENVIPSFLRIIPPYDCLPGKRPNTNAKSKGTVSTDLMLDEIWALD